MDVPARASEVTTPRAATRKRREQQAETRKYAPVVLSRSGSVIDVRCDKGRMHASVLNGVVALRVGRHLQRTVLIWHVLHSSYAGMLPASLIRSCSQCAFSCPSILTAWQAVVPQAACSKSRSHKTFRQIMAFAGTGTHMTICQRLFSCARGWKARSICLRAGPH